MHHEAQERRLRIPPHSSTKAKGRRRHHPLQRPLNPWGGQGLEWTCLAQANSRSLFTVTVGPGRQESSLKTGCHCPASTGPNSQKQGRVWVAGSRPRSADEPHSPLAGPAGLLHPQQRAASSSSLREGLKMIYANPLILLMGKLRPRNRTGAQSLD